MIDELKKIGLAGLGAAALVVEKAGEAVDTLAKHGEKTLENTREAREEISRNLSDCFRKAEPEVEEIIDKISRLSADSLAAIREKISELEILRAQQAAEQAEREAQAHAEAIDVDITEDAQDDESMENAEVEAVEEPADKSSESDEPHV